MFGIRELNIFSEGYVFKSGSAGLVIHDREEASAERVAAVALETCAADIDQPVRSVNAKRTSVSAIARVSASAYGLVVAENAVNDIQVQANQRI
jgi:hypothetical protein